MHVSSVNKSNQPSSTDEVTSRRPRSLFEDASLSADAKINVLLPEKHLHTDTNALDASNHVPNPFHSYVRHHPYYRTNSKSVESTAMTNQICDLQSGCLGDVSVKSQPLATMFANMPKFDLIPNLADSQDFTHSYDLPMDLSGVSIDSQHNTVINSDITMAYSAPAINSNNRVNGTIRSYASVAAAPPSQPSVSRGISILNSNVSRGSMDYSIVPLDLKKSVLDSKKSVSNGAPSKPPLLHYKSHLLEPVPELAEEVDSAGDLEDSDIDLITDFKCDNGNSLDFEYLDLRPLHFHFNYNSRDVEMSDFLIYATLQFVADLTGFDYVSAHFAALRQSLEPRLLSLASSLNVIEVVEVTDVELECPSDTRKSADAVIAADLLHNTVSPVTSPTQVQPQSQQQVQIVPDFDDSADDLPARDLALQRIANKPSQEFTIEDDRVLFEAQESQDCSLSQPQSQDHFMFSVQELDEDNITRYGDLDTEPLLIADFINNNCIEDFKCFVCNSVELDELRVAELKQQHWFPFVTGCRCPQCSGAADWTFEFQCYNAQCTRKMMNITDLAYHFIWQHNDRRHSFIRDSLCIHECDNLICHALVPGHRQFCYSHSTYDEDIGRYQCENCNKLVDLSHLMFWNILDFKQFVLHYYCDSCAALTKLTILQCDLDNCKKYYKGRRALHSWQQHMRKKHSNNDDVVKMLNLHFCMMPDCRNLIEMDQVYCLTHVNSDWQAQEDFISNIRDDFGFIDDNLLHFKDGSVIDMNELFAYIAYDQHMVKSDIMRGEVARILVDGMRDIACDASDIDFRLQREMRGVFKLKLIPMIFYFKTYRASDYARERDIRLGLYKSFKYRQLLDHVIQYQNKLNDKSRRRLLRNQSQRDAFQISSDDSLNQNAPLSDFGAESKQQPSDAPLAQDLAHTMYSRKQPQQIDPIISKFAQLRADPSELTYYNWEDVNDITFRIKRCVDLAKLGLWKKSIMALYPTRLVDIYANNNLQKGRSKYPSAPKPSTFHTPLKDWKLERAEIVEIFKKINPASSSGKSGINNKLILWMIRNDNQFNFIHVFILFLKKIICIGLPAVISRLLMHSTLILLGKPKHNIPDFDVRPIAVADAVIRLCDKVISYKIDELTRTRLIGPYQIIGKKRALEKSAVMQRLLLILQRKLDEIVTINIDAANAYNSISRQYIWNIIKDVDTPLSNWFHFLYSDPIRLDLDCKSSVMMEEALFQGLTTSQDFYDVGKWRILNLIVEDCILRFNDFKSFLELHYVDDSKTAINYKHLDYYIERSVVRYAEAGVKVNKSKSLVALETVNPTIIDAVQRVVDKHGLRVTFDNNNKFLGLPYGTDEFVNNWMNEKIDKLWILYRHVLHVKSNFIRWNLLNKMLEYCKFRYYLGHVKAVGNWMQRLQKLHDSVYHEYRMGMQPRHIMRHQIHMSQKAGGLGLRSPQLFKPAAEISTLRGLRDFVDKYFLFLPYSFNAELSQNRQKYSMLQILINSYPSIIQTIQQRHSIRLM